MEVLKEVNCTDSDLRDIRDTESVSSVGGSIRTPSPKETATESRKGSIAKEESALEKNSRRCAVEKTVIWHAFKSVVFFICLIFLIIQSVEFIGIYYQYRTNIVTEITSVEEFKFPAITLCFRNTISFQRFCHEEPAYCEEPNNLEKFCEKHRFICKGGNSTLKVPKQDEYTRSIMQDYLFNDDYNDNEHLFWNYNYSSKVRTFVRDMYDVSLYLKCYSENLHLYRSRSELKTKKLDFSYHSGDLISRYKLKQTYIKPLDPLDTPQVFVAIHSPLSPLDPAVDLQPIKREWWYDVDVHLEEKDLKEKEEHLLPPPYQTNCTENGPTKDANEFTNPNSHQMCMDLCRLEHDKAMFDCSRGMTMIPSEDMCYKGFVERKVSSEQRVELRDKRNICFHNCRQGCLRLRYNYKIKGENWQWLKTNDISDIRFYVDNPEVTILRHVPLYCIGDIFSHVGGLIGCWLGISVFTFTDIVEKFFRKDFKLKKKRKEERDMRTQTSEIHLE